MRIERKWAMPNLETFSIKPISELLDRYLTPEMRVLDPFARNSKRGTITNDVNPETEATFHLEAVDFLDWLVPLHLHEYDVVLFDPPYSPRQISECYKVLGRKATMEDTQIGGMVKKCRDLIDGLLKPGGLVISCGWNTAGQGKVRGYECVEILIVAHGGTHNDTLVTVERKLT